MAVGDTITRNGQYEFQQLLFNGGPNLPFRMMSEVDGLWDIDAKVNDTEKQLDHGRWHGSDFVEGKLITCKFSLLGITEADVNALGDGLRGACQPQGIDVPFVFQDTGLTGKKVIYVRPRKLALPRTVDKTTGRLDGSMALDAGDPRIYSLTQTNQAITLVGTASSGAQAVCTNQGWFTGGTYPKLVISGPSTNPRLTNATLNRTIALDLTVGIGNFLYIDTALKIASFYDNTGGVIDYTKYIGDAGSGVRSDNQWWGMQPGGNTIAYSRGSNSASSTLTVTWQDAWV